MVLHLTLDLVLVGSVLLRIRIQMPQVEVVVQLPRTAATVHLHILAEAGVHLLHLAAPATLTPMIPLSMNYQIFLRVHATHLAAHGLSVLVAPVRILSLPIL